MNNGSFALTDDAYFEQAFRRKAQELVTLVLAKRKDYGSSVGYHGSRGLLPRIADKFFRLDALVWNGKSPNFEKAEDTAVDLAVYAIMLAIDLEYERNQAMPPKVERISNVWCRHDPLTRASECHHGACNPL